MKIVFFGTSDIAVAALEALIRIHQIACVVTAPDKKRGRGQRISFSPVKKCARKRDLKILQPENLRDVHVLQTLDVIMADLFVVCSYGKILPKELLQIPKIYTINVHTSLLPKYRGAAPINWALINGERKTGVTIFKMNEHMDQGEIVLQQGLVIEAADTAETLTKKLSKMGAILLCQSIDLIEKGKATYTKQNEIEVTYAPKLKKEDGLINWEKSALEIHNRIRGLQPWPGAFTYIDQSLLKILSSVVMQSTEKGNFGEVVETDKKRGIIVQTGKGRLLLTRLQLEGKRKMSATEFIAGHKIDIGKRLGK